MNYNFFGTYQVSDLGGAETQTLTKSLKLQPITYSIGHLPQGSKLTFSF